MTEETNIRDSVEVELPLEAAFARFVDDIGEWWPSEYTASGEALEEIGIEAREGGRCYERGPEDFHVDWGRITIFEPPEHIVFKWQIGPSREPLPNPAHASEVDIRFTPEDDSTTRVDLEHRELTRHGEEAADYAAALAADGGWPYILGRYAKG